MALATFSYPLTFATEAEHVAHVHTFAAWYRRHTPASLDGEGTLDRGRALDAAAAQATVVQNAVEGAKSQVADMKRQLALMQQKSAKDRATIERLTSCAQKASDVGASAWIGKGFEAKVKAALEEALADTGCRVQAAGGAHELDVYVHHPSLKGTRVGIECKNKKTVTQADVTKWKGDVVVLGVCGSVFASTTPVPNTKKSAVQAVDATSLIVVETDPRRLATICLPFIAQCFLRAEIDHHEHSSTTEQRTDALRAKLDAATTFISAVYGQCEAMKRALARLDATLVNYFKAAGMGLSRAHNYLVPRGKLNTPTPYGRSTSQPTKKAKRGALAALVAPVASDDKAEDTDDLDMT